MTKKMKNICFVALLLLLLWNFTPIYIIMKIQNIFLALVACLVSVTGKAQRFGDYFEDKTLRLDYTFSGDNRHQEIYLDELSQSEGWYGRRGNLDSLFLQGNGQLTVTDPESHKTLYRYSFSTLFQEWQSSEEATKVRKSFENVFLMPFPKKPVDVTISLTDTHNQVKAKLTHRVDPKDILIRQIGKVGQTPWKYIHKGADSKRAIDVVIMAEGYTEEEMDKFWEDCQMSVDAFLTHEPFKSLGEKFNFIAVFSASKESGVSIPHKDLWVNTALGGNYDTFYSERYLTTLKLKRVHDVLAGIPYEHIIILANTENYGGGGIYNSYMMSSAHHAKTRPVIVHEFGHSFGGLGDEYFYDDQYETMYPGDTEPWEPNLTTLVDFKSKWMDMLHNPAPEKKVNADGSVVWENIDTPDGKDLYTKVGVYEGGGYQSKGVYRPVQECRMKINEAPVFCPVCDRAIRRIVKYYTE